MGMDPFLAKSLDKAAPKANLDILRGITVSQMEHFAESIDEIWQTVAKDFPPQVKYLGWRYCKPEEEFINDSRPRRGPGREVDVAPNDITMAMYRIGFVHPSGEIEELPPTYIFLPFVGLAGKLNLSGAQWAISPMLGDQVLSFEKDRVFCQLSRAKFHIENVNHPIHVDGQCYEFNVPWSVLYNINSTKESIKITLLHYILSTYGLKKTMELTAPELGEVGFFDSIEEANKIMASDRSKWVLIEGSKLKQKPFFGGSSIVAIVDAQRWNDAPLWTRTILASLFFTFDRFNSSSAEIWGGEMKAHPSYSEDISRWRLLMGLVLWERTKNPGIIMEDMHKHMSSLDRYIDDLVRPRIGRIGLASDNLYDFFLQIIKKWEDWRLNSYKKSAPLYDKEINVLYQVNVLFMEAIFYFYFNLENEAAKNNVTIETVKKLLKAHIRPRMIYHVRKKSHRYVAPISYSGDNAFCKITSMIVPQRGGNSSGGEGTGAAATRLHASLSEVTSPINLTKKDSTGLTRLNPFTQLENLMYIVRNPKMAELTDKVQAILDLEMKTSEGVDIESELDITEIERAARSDD